MTRNGHGGPGRGERGGLGDEQVYEVFARKKRADRFQHIGAVFAPSRQLARVYAWHTYDEAKWFEMTVAPRNAFASVNLSHAPFTLGRADGSPERR